MKQPRRRKTPLVCLDRDRFVQMWLSDAVTDDILAAFGISMYTMYQIKADLGLHRRSPRKPWHCPRVKGVKVIDPDLEPEEVQHRIAKVQATWTDEVFLLRSIGRVRPLPYKFPVYSLGSLR